MENKIFNKKNLPTITTLVIAFAIILCGYVGVKAYSSFKVTSSFEKVHSEKLNKDEKNSLDILHNQWDDYDLSKLKKVDEAGECEEVLTKLQEKLYLSIHGEKTIYEIEKNVYLITCENNMFQMNFFYDGNNKILNLQYLDMSIADQKYFDFYTTDDVEQYKNNELDLIFGEDYKNITQLLKSTGFISKEWKEEEYTFRKNSDNKIDFLDMRNIFYAKGAYLYIGDYVDTNTYFVLTYKPNMYFGLKISMQ